MAINITRPVLSHNYNLGNTIIIKQDIDWDLDDDGLWIPRWNDYYTATYPDTGEVLAQFKAPGAVAQAVSDFKAIHPGALIIIDEVSPLTPKFFDHFSLPAHQVTPHIDPIIHIHG